MIFDRYELSRVERTQLLMWLERTGVVVLTPPRSAPYAGRCWRLRQPLEMRGRRYEPGTIVVIDELNNWVAIEAGGTVGGREY